METRFSKRLSLLMKERKISGQKLGAAVGKSQKTISRYATGEVEPSEEMKNIIYRAIANFSGIVEDGMTEAELDEQEFFWRWSEEYTKEIDCIERRLAQDVMNKLTGNASDLIKVFQKLSLGAKKYYLTNFETLHLVEDWENAVLDFFHGLSASKQEELVRYLENFNFDYKTLGNVGKLSAYMKMIKNAERRPILIIDRLNEGRIVNGQKDSLIKEFEEMLLEISTGKRQGVMPIYPWFLSYTPYDWYFLLRVQIYELYDKQTCLWDEELGTEIGVKLAHLLDAMK